MTRFRSILVGAVTAIVAGVLAGVVASLTVDWYNVPSREGASGYFVLLFIALGLVVGFAIGLATGRIVAGRPDPGFLKALGLSQMTLLSLVLVIGLGARLLADVGPTIDGKTLLVNVEVRWPEGAELPADTSGGWFVRLSSASGYTVRRSTAGPLWREDARQEDGRWIVPGAVDLFTSRGRRLISVEPEGVIPSGYEVPIPAWPGPKALEWSEWLPRTREGTPPVPGGITYRWRLVPEDQPIRLQRFGGFEIATIASSVTDVRYSGEPRTWSASARFVIRYRGAPVAFGLDATDGDRAAPTDTVEAVALLPGADTALLALAHPTGSAGTIWLAAPEGDGVRTTPVAEGASWISAPLVTNDPDRFHRAAQHPRDGRVDETRFETPGLYLFSGVLFDSRRRSVRPSPADTIFNLFDRIPPLGLSPDEQSFIRLGYQPDSTEAWTLEVFNTAAGVRYRLPLDRYRMRIGGVDEIDPSDVARFFEWRQGADGLDHLVPRAHPVPRPYRGVMSSDDPGYREYRVYLATDSLRAALIDWLVAEFHAAPVATDSGAYAKQVTVNGQTVYLSWDPADGHVGVWVDRGSDTGIVRVIAERWNAVLATGKYDRCFEQNARGSG